jgi:GH15 family glucan-1,4-alpha-glucosidase
MVVKKQVSIPISDYALLGNLRCAALVSRQGSIDWFCPKQFDAPACFAALLGDDQHGCWSLAPSTDEVAIERHYHDGTMILETCFTTPTGIMKVTDLMPLGDGCHLVRLVECVQGEVTLMTRCAPRFNYGKTLPEITHDEKTGGIIFHETGHRLRLTTTGHSLSFNIIDNAACASVRLTSGKQCAFILSFADRNESLTPPPDAYQTLQECSDWWINWTERNHYQLRWGDAVKRSLITLKAMTYQPSGGMVAAPTTSLPEVIGGTANYDYRYCWLRDAAFAVKVLLNSGPKEEAADWLNWLLKAVSNHDEPLHALYTIDATIAGDEQELPWLPGYLDSRPVRAGNAASRQYQLDVRGELMEVLHLARRSDIPMSADIWQLQCKILEELDERWCEPDTGIWEFRTIKDHLTHSKVMAWVAYDRCIRDAECYNLTAPLEHWRAQRDAIRADILQNGVDKTGGFFTQRYGSTEVDASLLMIPLVGFVSADDPRMLATLAAIERDLCEDGLVYRYRTGDQAGNEGVFLACCFWLADNYWLAGRKQEAVALFERLLSLCNDVGLLAEEYDLNTQQLLGNFPQGLSHLALISTARLMSTASEDEVSLN